MSDHLGNVRAVVSDEALARTDGPVGLKPDLLACFNYYPFGMEHPGRVAPGNSTLAGGYRFGYNGKEKDNNGELGLTNYDYGARIYNPAYGRWMTIDPKASKFPNESPYIFTSGNPIVFADPNGEEKIVVSGGADVHNMKPSNRLNFIRAAAVQLHNYKSQVEDTQEKVTWVVFDLDYNSTQKEEIARIAKEANIDPPIYVSSAAEVVSYIHAKTLTASGQVAKGTGEITNARKSDLVTSLSMFSHGVPDAVAFGYDNSGVDNNAWSRTDLSREGKEQSKGIKSLSQFAFAKVCQIDVYSCNAALPIPLIGREFTSVQSLVDEANAYPNIINSISSAIPQATVTGFIGQTTYAPSYEGKKLPQGATTDGGNEVKVNGKHTKSIQVTSKKGSFVK